LNRHTDPDRAVAGLSPSVRRRKARARPPTLQSSLPLRSLVPESFRGGCSFGAGRASQRARSLPQASEAV